MSAFKDLTGRIFGRLTVVSCDGKGKNNAYHWLCRCECRNETIVSVSGLLRAGTKSCGCLNREISRIVNTTHGKRKTRLYEVWAGMKSRCLNKNNINYKNYGGRGIKVCDRWRRSFEDFYVWSMTNGYDPEGRLTLDRIDNDGNYTPKNCRWTTHKKNCNNTRKTVFVNLFGEDIPVQEAQETYGLCAKTLKKKLLRNENLNEYYKWFFSRTTTKRK